MRASLSCAVAIVTALAAPAIAQSPGGPSPGSSPTSEVQAAAPSPGIAIPGSGLTLTSTATLSTDDLSRGGTVSLDPGYIAHLHPGQSKPPGTQLNENQEVALRASSQVTEALKLPAAFNWSPNFFGRSGIGYYVEGCADLPLPLGLTGLGQLGYPWIERNPRFGTPNYLWYRIGVQREVVLGMTLAVGWYDTNISQRECAPVADRADAGQKICDGRVLVTLSRTS